MKIKVVCSSLFLFAILSSPSTQAGGVEKCVDANGKITFTDKGCKSKETSQEPYIGKTKYKKFTSTAIDYKVAEIVMLTDQANKECTKQAAKYFVDNNPAVKDRPRVDFTDVVDRKIKGIQMEIVLAGILIYKNEKETKQMNIQCTATKSRENLSWTLVFNSGDN